MLRATAFCLTISIAFAALPLRAVETPVETPVKILLDTDFGDDGDDLAALAVLHHLADLGEVEILAIGQSNSRHDAPGAIDVINTYYGRPDIPIGIVKYTTHEGDQYSSFLVKNYPHDIDLKNVPDVIEVYRRALAEASDQSVKFVVIGPKQNMRDLLQSKPDAISPLSGVELIRQKVTVATDMGGRLSFRRGGVQLQNFGRSLEVLRRPLAYSDDLCRRRDREPSKSGHASEKPRRL